MYYYFLIEFIIIIIIIIIIIFQLEFSAQGKEISLEFASKWNEIILFIISISVYKYWIVLDIILFKNVTSR